MYTTKVYKAVGGDAVVVASGGKIIIQPGGEIDMEGEIVQSITFDEDHFTIDDGEVTLKAEVATVIAEAAHGTPVANVPAVPEDLSDSANGAAIAAAVNGNAAAINAIIAALEAFGISLPDA